MAHASPPALWLFGRPAYRAEGAAPVVFPAERPYQLLAYLACHGGWVGRDELADWLFPDRTQSAARSNLRKVLLLARALAGLPPIELQGDRLRWAPDSDLRRFESACERSDDAELAAWYRPPLLQDMEPGLGRRAADWLDFERERLASRWHAVVAARLEALAGTPSAAATLAEAALAVDPLDETAIAALARARVALGQPDTARAILQSHRQRLADTLGLEPSAAVRGLAAGLSTASSASMAAAPNTPIRPDAAIAGGTFIGRRLELAQLQDWLSRDDCRLATLMGPGGIGKSTLARAAWSALAPHFAGGSWWLPLDDLVDGAQATHRFAALLDLELAGPREPLDQVVARLGSTACLLALDNAEHLPDIGQWLATLIGSCPGLRVLVTSRSRLHLAGEWLLPLDGLPLPDADEQDLEVLRSNDAVRLFEARALASSPDFRLAGQAADVVRLVHAVDGMPLALDLAAPWVRLLPLREIIAELAASPDLLAAGDTASMPRRERSLLASFDRSWRLLSELERSRLCALAALPGEFDRAMARQVADAPLPVLASLADKSLLRADGSGRFSIHPLLRQCALQRAHDTDAVLAAHAGHMARSLHAASALATFPMAEFERDLPHARAAWAWAVARGDADLLGQLTPALSTFYEESGRTVEGADLFQGATPVLGANDRDGGRAATLVWVALAKMHFRSGWSHPADVAARRGLELARSRHDVGLALACLNILGLDHWVRTEFADASRLFREGLELAEREQMALPASVARSNLALVEKALGHYDEALRLLQHVLAKDRLVRSDRQAATTLNNIANVYRAMLRPQDALIALHQALAITEPMKLHSTTCFALANIALAHLDTADHEAARPFVQRAMALRQQGPLYLQASILAAQAAVSRLDGDLPGARRWIGDALATAGRSAVVEDSIACVQELGHILRAEGHTERAAALLRWCAGQALQDRLDRDAAQRGLDALGLTDAALARCERLLPVSATLAQALAIGEPGAAMSSAA